MALFVYAKFNSLIFPVAGTAARLPYCLFHVLLCANSTGHVTAGMGGSDWLIQ